MNVPLWVTETAEHFWNLVGNPEPYPRQLRFSMTFAFPITIVEQSPLWTSTIARWLENFGIDCELVGTDRPLCACLVARAGFAFLFLDSSDPPEEQRFSLAHELAHFLRDYYLPRKQAVETLGPDVIDVLDGRRPATLEERLHSVLRNVPLGLHVHLLQRNKDGQAEGRVAQVESDADRLAWELLAPASHVLKRISHFSCPDQCSRCVPLLEESFGLPHEQALRYSQSLLPTRRTDDALLLNLKKNLRMLSNFPPSDGK